MITKTQLGEKHKNVLSVQFGTGDIMFPKLQFEDEGNVFGLAFMQTEPHGIGEETSEYSGGAEMIEKFPAEVQVIFKFTKPESITALIHSLVELQQSMFDGKLKS